VNNVQGNPQCGRGRALPVVGCWLRLVVMAREAEFSGVFAATAREEAERLRVRSFELRARGERWVGRGEEALAEAARLEARVRELDEMLGRAPQLRLDLQSEELRGRELREAALRVLLERLGQRRPIHYRDWYGLLGEHGVVAAGKDPVATFLTQITRSPLVERVKGESGVYLVDPGRAYKRARAELAEASRDLRAAEDRLNPVQESEPPAAEAVKDARTAQARLTRARRDLDAVVAARSSLLRDRLTAA
jgi:hypothetical protein